MKFVTGDNLFQGQQVLEQLLNICWSCFFTRWIGK